MINIKGKAKFLIAIFAISFLPDILLAQTANAPIVPSAADFGKSLDRNFVISPDGRYVAFMSGPNENAVLTLLDLQEGTENPIATGDKVKPRSLFFADNRHLLITVSFFLDTDKTSKTSLYKYEISRTISYNLETKKTKILVPDDRLEQNVSLNVVQVDNANNRVLIAGLVDNPFLFEENANRDLMLSLYYSDLDTGKGKNLVTGNTKTREFFIDPEGVPRLRLDIDKPNNKTALLKYKNKKWEVFDEWPGKIELPYDIQGFLDKDNLLITEDVDGVSVAFKYNIETKTKERHSPNEKASIAGIETDPLTKKPIAIYYDDNRQMKWLEEKLAKSQELLDKTFKGQSVDIFGWDAKFSNFLVGVERGNSVPKTYLFNIETKSAGELSVIPESFTNFKLPPKTRYTFKASDGLEIPVYVTKPDNITKPMPTIVLPHGGPRAKDSPDFDDLSQFLATRGYVVIQPQFRGSTGNGYDFMMAGYGQWAGKMQSDVDEAFDWAVAQKWADPKRTCIVGASYGGYSALVGATLNPNKYTCASSYGGVFDLAAMFIAEEAQSGEDSASVAYWKEHIGASRYDTQKIHAISPIYSVSKIKIPVQLIHGIEDSVVLIEQSRAMSKAMKKANIPHEYIEIPKEDHWLSTEVGKTRYFMELERFLAGVLKPGQ